MRGTLALVLLLCMGCSSEDDGFVRLVDDSFHVNGRTLFPVVMNIQVNVVFDGHSMWPASYSGYNPGDRYRFHDADRSAEQLHAELALLAQNGFNTVRVTGFVEAPHRFGAGITPYPLGHRPDGYLEPLDLTRTEVRERFLGCLDRFLAIAAEERLHVILLTTIYEGRPGSQELFVDLAEIGRAHV